jgi:anti-sigma B factor antagonist
MAMVKRGGDCILKLYAHVLRAIECFFSRKRESGGKNMDISKNQTDKSLDIALAGRLDTTTAPKLEAELKQSIGDNTELNLDFAKLEYISSAGLRVLLAAQKVMNRQGKMVIRNVNDVISEVFEVTGFSDILTIE